LITPSRGMNSPAFTRTTSPGSRCRDGTMTSEWPTIFRAGTSFSRVRKASTRARPCASDTASESVENQTVRSRIPAMTK